MQLFYKSLVVLILLASALTGCKKTNQDEVINPDERGQFKLVLSDYLNVSQSGTKAEAQKPWESALKSLHLYAIKRATDNTEATTDPCVYYHEFSAKELDSKKSVFSIPSVEFEKEYDFYVIANTTASVPTTTSGTTRATLEALAEASRITDYNNAAGFSAMNDGTYYTSGKGFAMSGKAMKKTPSKNDDFPTNVTVSLNRLVAKLEVQCTVTQTFKDKYTGGTSGHGGTFTIKSVEVTNVANQGVVMPTTSTTASSNLQQLTQTASYAGDVCDGLFYFYENGITGTSPISTKPRLVVRATYEFDGNPAIDIVYDNEKLNLKGQGAASPAGVEGLFLRNARYTVDLKINGLTPSEVVATITVNDWAVAINQDIEFGSTTNP